MTLAPMLLLAAFAADPPAVAVLGPSTGAGARARLAVETAIAVRADLSAVPLERWRSAARAARSPPTAAASDAAIARIAPGAGADAVLLVSTRGSGKARSLRVRLLDARGRELWSGAQPLAAGDLSPVGARAIADGVAVALLPGPAKPTPSGEAPSPPPAAEPPPEPPPPPAPAAAAAPPVASGERPRGPAEPTMRFEVGVPLTWRSSSVDLVGSPPIAFTTGTPYLSFLLDARVAPLRAWRTGQSPRWAEPAELDLHYSHRFLTSKSTANGVETSAASREDRFSVDLRYPWLLPTRTAVAARLGYAIHHFSIDQDLLPASTRGGVRLGVEAEHPFLPWASGELGLRLYPFSGPSADEKARFGPDGSGLGYELLVGASGPLARVYQGLGWRVGYDLLHFSDSFSGGVARGGAATYHSLAISATFAR